MRIVQLKHAYSIIGFIALTGFGCSSSNDGGAAGSGGSSNANGGASNGGTSGANGGSGNASGGTGNASAGSAGTTTGTLTGNFTVELHPEDKYAVIGGQIFEAPQPSATPLDVAQEQSGCKLLIPRAVSCTPECATTSVCTGNNQCTPKPNPVSLGTVHVEGLGGRAIDMEAQKPAYAYAGPTLADTYPPCKEGDDIKLTSDLLSINGKCIATLDLLGPTPLAIRSGQAADLSWTPPGKTNISRIQIRLEISHHGGYKGEIDCDVPDSGSFSIPEPLVTALIARGIGGYPTIKVTRSSSAAASNQPGVKLVMPSLVERAVDHGVQSCGGQDAPPCPSGQTCNQEDRLCH